MIQHKLLLIEVEDDFRAIKIKKQEEYIKLMMCYFAEWFYANAKNYPHLTTKQLLTIYLKNAEDNQENGGRSFETLL